MASRKTEEDNYYTREQYNRLITTKFPPVKVFESEDGREFFVTHPQVLDDEQQDAVDAASKGTDVARAYLGDAYEAFKSSGGQSWMVGYHIQQIVEREQAKGDDGTPTP